MAFTLNVESRGSYMYFSVTGENSIETVNRYLSEVQKICLEHKCHNLLIVENLAGAGLDTFGIFDLVSKRSEQASQIVRKLAYVDINPEHNIKNMEFAEDVAVNRGMSVKIFPTIQEAEEWMEKQV